MHLHIKIVSLLALFGSHSNWVECDILLPLCDTFLDFVQDCSSFYVQQMTKLRTANIYVLEL